MSEIVFQPWIGSTYEHQQKRILLVGESHYGEPNEDFAAGTKTVVEKWKRHEWNIRYLVAAARVLTGLERSQLNRAEVLEHIAFYNFVQVSMPWNDTRPTSEQFRASSPAFIEVVALLKPTHILVTGKETWSYLPPEGAVEFTKLGAEPMPLRRYRTCTGEAKATAIPHLSRYFSPPRWHQAVVEFLAL